MDPAVELIYRERIPLDESALRAIRTRIRGFAPLLGDQTEDALLAADEIASAFIRHGGAESFEVRLYAGEDRCRVELLDSMISEANLTAPQDDEGAVRLKVLEAVTERWGVLGDGISLVWFEVRRGAAATEDISREM
ncbi:MAG TPA: hypothetical protein VJ930_03475 [Acidimicrobiia bacterium]|nr:hypothetical protein [Acidimicrobiia bacterium]